MFEDRTGHLESMWFYDDRTTLSKATGSEEQKEGPCIIE